MRRGRQPMGDTTIESGFELSPRGGYRTRRGAGWSEGARFSRKKLCLSSTDPAFLAGMLLSLSRRPDCYFVKFAVRARDGMYAGRCFLLEDRRVGELWRRLKGHPKLLCTVQDDEFTADYRSRDGGGRP